MAEIEGAILDLDGVITDTAEFHFLSWKRMAEEEDIEFEREDNEKLRGVSRRRSLELILGERTDEFSEDEIERLMSKKNSYYQERIAEIDEDDMLPGARELMEECRERGMQLAIASSSRNARIVLENLGITAEFEAISDGYSVKNPKPAPDLFLHTADKLGLPAEKCLVVEDAESGIDGALEADMLAVGVGPEDRLDHAHIRFDSVEEVDLDEIIECAENL